VPAQDDDIKEDVFPFSAQSHPASGIFTWEVATDLVYCDDAVAGLFGFPITEFQNGRPLRMFLDRIHADDLPRVARAIHDALITGFPYQEDYRINRPDGTSVAVTAFGSCFRDSTGEPRHYAGMLVPITDSHGSETDLLSLCLSAYAAATQQGETGIGQKLLDLVGEIEARDGARPMAKVPQHH
jgi:hypothetical protein